MRIESVYDNRYLIPTEHECNFYSKRKTTLSMIEKVGLQEIAVEFLCKYCEEVMGEPVTTVFRQELRDIIQWRENSLDICDGIEDTFEFDGFLFGSIWMTDNGIPMLTAFELPEPCREGEDDWSEHDWISEFTPRLFRLN